MIVLQKHSKQLHNTRTLDKVRINILTIRLNIWIDVVEQFQNTETNTCFGGMRLRKFSIYVEVSLNKEKQCLKYRIQKPYWLATDNH